MVNQCITFEAVDASRADLLVACIDRPDVRQHFAPIRFSQVLILTDGVQEKLGIELPDKPDELALRSYSTNLQLGNSPVVHPIDVFAVSL